MCSSHSTKDLAGAVVLEKLTPNGDTNHTDCAHSHSMNKCSMVSIWLSRKQHCGVQLIPLLKRAILTPRRAWSKRQIRWACFGTVRIFHSVDQTLLFLPIVIMFGLKILHLVVLQLWLLIYWPHQVNEKFCFSSKKIRRQRLTNMTHIIGFHAYKLTEAFALFKFRRWLPSKGLEQ